MIFLFHEEGRTFSLVISMPCVGAGLCLLDSNIKGVASEGSAVPHHWASGSYDWNYHQNNFVHRNW